LALAAELIKRNVRADGAEGLTEQVLEHLDNHYVNCGANAAAAKGMETLLGASLPRTSRILVLRAQARCKTGIALEYLAELVRAGQLPDSAMVGLPGPAEAEADASAPGPGRIAALGKMLAEVMAIFETINTEYPAQPAWTEWVDLAGEVRKFSPKAAQPKDKTQLKATDAWAIGLVMPIVEANADDAALKSALEAILGVLDDYTADRAPVAVAGVETLLGLPLSGEHRLAVLQALARYKTGVAMEHLDELVRTAKLPAEADPGSLPKVFGDVLAVYQTINKEYPTEPAWSEQIKLADQVRQYVSKVRSSVALRRFKSPDAWAIDLALPVVGQSADDALVQQAVDTVQGILAGYATMDGVSIRQLSVDVSRTLVAEVTPSESAWVGVMTRHAELLDGQAKLLLSENLEAGHGDRNAKLCEEQQELLATLKKLVAHDVQHAPAALERIRAHLQPWIAHAHWVVAEEVYTTLAEVLPRPERRQAELAIVGLWVRQVTGEHQRLTATGFTVPRQLDPTLAKALARCYQLQAGLDEDSPELTQVRSVWDGIVAHYKALEYYDVAQAAIEVKAAEAVDLADEYAAFQLVRLEDEHARRELGRLLKQYGGSDRIALGPEFQVAIAGWKQFITERPDSPLVPQATQAIFGVAELFGQHTAHLVAAEVYADLAGFAAGIDVLSQSLPGKASTAERAAFARATALDAQARKMLAKQMADRKSDDPPPVKLSDEFASAIAAYSSFITDHPESSLVSNATSKIMAVAGEYAKIDAWDVADGVFADLLASKLDIRRPELLKFARGVCQLGRAMPGHAREVLSTLTSTGLRGPGTATDPAMLAGMYHGTMPAGAGRGSRASEGASPFTPPPSRQPVAEPDSTPSPVVPGAINLVEKIPDLQANIGSLQTEQLGIGGGTFAQPSDEANRDAQLLAMINQQEAQRALQVAQMRENIAFYQTQVQQDDQQAGQGQQAAQQVPAAPVISEAELARQEKAIAAAYDIFQAIRKDHALTPTAEQARGEILVMVGHWRGLTQWQLAAELAQRFLDDNRTDRERPKLSLEAARDWLAWAAKPIGRKATRQEMLKAVSDRFDTARTKLSGVVADFPKEKSYQQQAQWDVAKSFLTQARVIGAFSPTLARGQYVRTAKELRRVAEEHCDHPQISTIPQMLWEIASELEGRGFDNEAIVVWNELAIYDPMHGLSQQAATKIAQTYHQKLKRPLRAAQAYQELNFARGGNDQALQDAIFQIGSELKSQKRYVEALHVLETFVDSFPRHAQAGQALTMVGQIHQTNEAWEDAIAAYRRVIDEYENGQFRQDAKWAIAECTINLSQWREATEAYREYVADYTQDAKVAEANRRIEVLKDLVRYQGLVDQEGQRKAFDAQFQIATIVRDQLANPVKAIIEFRKVVADWPQSHLADDALYAVGTAYLTLEETDKAREALLEVAAKYPGSPLADDALYVVGKSHEDEATRLATVTRETTLARNKEMAQRRAYQLARDNLYKQQEGRSKKIADLKEMGKGESAEFEQALKAGNFGQYNDANVILFAQKAEQEVEALTATQLADRQDKINAALRKAVEAYGSASKVAGADKADESLLQMATIYDQQLKDSDAAMATWLEIVRQFSGTSVAEDASWRIAQHYEREEKYAEAVKAYETFLQNYRGGERAAQAQFAIAENYEHLGEWVKAMDSYTNYVTNYPSGPLVAKAKSQIIWIKTYWL